MVNLRQFKTANERRKFLEKKLKISLNNVGSFSFSEDEVRNKNIENLIGATQVPLGMAGPLRLANARSGQARQNYSDYYVPLATTEGALVASVNRGCKAVSESGGVRILVEEVGVTRGPVFKTRGFSQSLEVKKWLGEHFDNIYYLSKQTSSHLELKKIETQILGKHVYIRFYFDTQEAMGMNMATIATNAVISFIEEQTGSRCISITGNFCVDKKPAWLNFILGRGKRVWAESVIKKEIVKEVLKTTSEKIYEVWLSKCMLGSAISGSMSFNAHFANVIAAIFLATGQDLAHVVEGSLGITMAEVEDNGDLYVSVYLPDLMVGTVGGGTGLETQKEALAIMGIENSQKGNGQKLAGIIAGAVLAGELSLLASLGEGTLAKAHQKPGRGLKYA